MERDPTTLPAECLTHRELAAEIERGCRHFWAKRGGDPFAFKWINPNNPFQSERRPMRVVCETCTGKGYTQDLEYCPSCGGEGLSIEEEEKPAKVKPRTLEQALASNKKRTIKRQQLRKRGSLY